MRIDLFPTLDEAGTELAGHIGRAIESAVPSADVRIVTNQSPLSMEWSMAAADAVVLDLTPAPDGAHRYTTMNYPWKSDHVLAVSRTYLPMNVAPRRPGGTGVLPNGKGSDEIVAWVLRQLTGEGAVQRRSLPRRLLSRFERNTAAASGVDAFISFRGTDAAAARALKGKLESGDLHDGRPQRVVLFEPGELAHPAEVLPHLLRWNVLSVISDVVRFCREFWVVDSADYLGSWWTQGELACRPYFRDTARLRAFDARTGVEVPPHRGLVAELTEAQRKRMVRLFVNSHPDLMAPESSEAMRQLRPLRWPTAQDDVYATEFATVPLLQCPRCSLGGVPPALDVDAFLHNTDPRLYPIPPEKLEQAAADGSGLACPAGCGQRFAVRQSPPRYQWFPLPVGPTKSHLAAIPTYFAQPA